jgi:magnesium transporter
MVLEPDTLADAGSDTEQGHESHTPTDASYAAEPGLMAATVYSGGRRICDIRVEEAHEWAAKPGHVVWIGLHEPSYKLLSRIQAQFGLHDLAIEDAGKSHNHPKIEMYGNGIFIVARTAQLVDGRIAFGETHIFVGRGYVVTVRHGASASYAAVRARCESCPTVLANGEHYILHAILDFIVDNYAPVVHAVHEEVEELEDRVLSAPLDQADIERLHILRRDLLRLRSAAIPLAEVCRRLEHTDVLPLAANMRLYFRDVTDHIHQVAAEIDSLRELLAFVFEASVMIGQMQQNDITRRLAAWAAILAVPTAVAGIYGMNFQNMPELKWEYGYFAVVGLIAVTVIALYAGFRRNGWL